MDFYEEWTPVNAGFLEFYLYELNEGFEGLKIVLREIGASTRGLELFYSSFLGYRVVDESGRLKTLYENNTFTSFNITSSSEFLDWFKEESRGMYNDNDLKHYSIVSSNKIVDIISIGDPNIKLFEF